MKTTKPLKTYQTYFANVFSALALSGLMSVIGCVSVNIGPKPGEKSSGVTFKVPAAPFQTLKTGRADGAWQNKKNGNSISFLSTCNDPTDPSLESATREMLADLKEIRTIQTESTMFDGRGALETEVEGQAEGVPTRVRTIVFKKNGCLYTVSFIGLAKVFEEDRGRFNDFLKTFEAP